MAALTVLSTDPVPVGSAFTTITLQNTAASTQTNVPFTFGQVFSPGQFPNSTPAIELRVSGGTTIPCQLNVKAKHPDGSIKHALISGIVPTMAASSSTIYDITRAASAPVGAAPVPSDFTGLNAVFTISDNGLDVTGPTAGTTYTADASVKLNAGSYVTWLSGPIVSEWIVRAPFITAGGVEHPDLHARFSIRAYKGQAKAKIDCVIENTWAKPKSPQPATIGASPFEPGISVKPVIYSCSLSIGGAVAYTRAVKGYHRARLTYNSNGTYPNNATGIPNDATVYTATVTVDGTAKAISVAGSSIQTYSQLYSVLNTQMGGLAVCQQDADALGLRIVSSTTGSVSAVVISAGTLFPALKNTQPYRPIRGDEFIHYANTRWKKTFWWGAEPQLHIAHDRDYLIDSMAVPNYTKSITGSATTIANDKAAMAANGDIGQNGITKGVMSAQGYANGIGILPEWQAMYLLNQGIDAKATMLKQADLGGSWSAYYRDYSTDEPINFSKWPYATLSPNAGDSRNSATGLNEMLPQRVATPQIEGNGYDADVAHHPDFYYVPYLVTGDHFYMEGMLSYFIYACLKQNAHATYRDGGKVLFKAESQIRGQGWLFRSLAHNRYLLPDNHSSRASLEYIASSNAASYNARYVDPAGPEYTMFGIFGGMEYTVGGQPYTGSSGFMEFHAISGIGRSVELGFDEFLPLLGYKSKLIKGLLTSGPDFCWQWATAYTLRWRDTSTSPKYTSWKQVYDNTLPYVAGIPANILSIGCGTPEMGVACGEGQNAMVGYPLDVGGFPSNMTPATAYCASYNMPSGPDAWLVLDSRIKKPDYNTGPQFAIEPRTFLATSTPTPTPPPSTMPVDTYTGQAGQTLYFGRSV